MSRMSALNCCVLIALSILVVESIQATEPDRSVSPSRQFVIYGADPTLRGNISNLAEEVKRNLLDILHQSDSWKTPIIINLQPHQANLPDIPQSALHFSQTGFGLKLQLDLVSDQNADDAFIQRELLRAVLLEMIYRHKIDIAPGTHYIEPPYWLIDGLLALSPGEDKSVLVDALAVSSKGVTLDEFLHQSPGALDSQAHLLYRACAFAFLKLLLDSSDGHLGLSRYIENLSASSNDTLSDLRTQFPTLRGDLQEIWLTALKAITNSESYELFSFEETNRRLDSLLRLKLAVADAPTTTIPLSDLARKKFSTGEKASLEQLDRQLALLNARANPSVRPIIREYQQVAEQIIRRRVRNLAKRLALIEMTRGQLGSRMSNIDDFMNWFEATQSQAPSGTFAEYLKSAVDEQNPSRRRDPLSIYLDSIESQL